MVQVREYWGPCNREGHQQAVHGSTSGRYFLEILETHSAASRRPVCQ